MASRSYLKTVSNNFSLKLYARMVGPDHPGGSLENCLKIPRCLKKLWQVSDVGLITEKEKKKKTQYEMKSTVDVKGTYMHTDDRCYGLCQEKCLTMKFLRCYVLPWLKCSWPWTLGQEVSNILQNFVDFWPANLIPIEFSPEPITHTTLPNIFSTSISISSSQPSRKWG